MTSGTGFFASAVPTARTARLGAIPSEYALQFTLYRKAVVEAYGFDVAVCRIERISEERCELEDVELPTEEETLRRVASVAKGIRNADVSARPGVHCSHCAYKATPCMDYPRKKRDHKLRHR